MNYPPLGRIDSDRVRVRACELQRGDVCTGSGAEVDTSPTRIAGGHVMLIVTYPRKRGLAPRRARVTWNASTTITVYRKETPNG